MYEEAAKKYEKIGVDTEKAMEALQNVEISLQCWQGDDVNGFLFKDQALSGGIQTTGNYPGKARTADELREDFKKAISLIPGKKRLSLHAIYADTDEKIDLDKIEGRHFDKWIDFAKQNDIKLDFNATCFSHPMASSGFTASSVDDKVREFWIDHCICSRKIAEYIGKSLNDKCVINYWFPDGYKDNPVDRLAPRERMKASLDKIFASKIDKKYVLDAIESKLFGIGAESYTTISNEFCLGYAVKNGISVCLDAGHFHPTEYISDKISSVLLFTDELLLHVSRPVRWDSDHVVILDDELTQIASSLVCNGLLYKTHIGLDYFDASINRIAAWIIGTRNMQKALLKAFLMPWNDLKEAENKGDYTYRLAMTEELKSYPFGEIWEEFLKRNGICAGAEWIKEIKEYEKEVTLKR